MIDHDPRTQYPGTRADHPYPDEAAIVRRSLRYPDLADNPDVRIVCFGDVEPEQVAWLWPGRIPFGKLTILEGMPDAGKSHITIALAAAVSRGQALPGGVAHEPADVLFVALEDDVADTQLPRAMAAGADVDRLHSLQGFGPHARPVTLPDDVERIREVIKATDAKLVIVDPITNHLGETINSFKDTDVRRALSQLAVVAAETECAILIVRHLTKANTGQALTAGAGSIGFVGLARSVLLAAKHPEDETLSVLACVKMNLGPKAPSLTYRLESQPGGCARVRWVGTTGHSANDLIAAAGDREDQEDRSELELAVDFLREQLANGSWSKTDLLRKANTAGIAQRTLERAKKQLRLVSKRSGFGGPVMWELPSPASSVADSLTSTPTGEYGVVRGANSLNDNADDSLATDGENGRREWEARRAG